MTDYNCKCYEKMGNDFFFLPHDKCLYYEHPCRGAVRQHIQHIRDGDGDCIATLIERHSAPRGVLDPIRGGQLT